jgi:hypothetical protein
MRDVAACGICDVAHLCHCPVLQSWCDDCLLVGLTERDMTLLCQQLRRMR